jgi:hypothetical protein
MKAAVKRASLYLLACASMVLWAYKPLDRSCNHPAWGFFGHKKINELAIYTLPAPLFGFYKSQMEYLVDHSVDPDKRRYGVVGEAECHYIDMDRYIDSLHPNPFDNVPRKWTDAVAKFSEDSLREHGIVPWNVNLVQIKLTNAFKDKDLKKILRYSAEIGHYIGDAHVPLHTTSNYNGQKTGQRGIHGFWESRLPELYHQNYDFFVGKCFYIESPLNYIWDRVEESYSAVDSVLSFERDLNEAFLQDQKYSFEARGNATVKVYSEGYSKQYSDMLDGQVERRMRSAVISVGSFWYTAWVNAGQPDLDFLNLENEPDMVDSITVDEKVPRVREHE